MSVPRSASSFIAVPPPAIPATPATDRSEFDLVGSSAAMKRVRLQMQRIGPHFRTVLVRGEVGTGKERVARALHGMGRGAGGPFVVCHAAALEGVLVECEAGAGSVDALGRMMKISERGTLFLDGVSEMPLEAQDRLMWALGEYERGQSQLEARQRRGLRVISSAKEDLRALVSTGHFRQDLYQRLATVEVALPPLRERIEDLPELARRFLGRFAELYGRDVHEIADEAMERMTLYCWPGNLRELEGVLRDGVLECKGEVLESHHLPVFPEASRPVTTTRSANESARLQDVMEQHVLRVLKDCGGNKLRAAAVLGISRSTLYRMLDAGASAATLR